MFFVFVCFLIISFQIRLFRKFKKKIPQTNGVLLFSPHAHVHVHVHDHVSPLPSSLPSSLPFFLPFSCLWSSFPSIPWPSSAQQAPQVFFSPSYCTQCIAPVFSSLLWLPVPRQCQLP